MKTVMKNEVKTDKKPKKPIKNRKKTEKNRKKPKKPKFQQIHNLIKKMQAVKNVLRIFMTITIFQDISTSI